MADQIFHHPDLGLFAVPQEAVDAVKEQVPDAEPVQATHNGKPFDPTQPQPRKAGTLSDTGRLEQDDNTIQIYVPHGVDARGAEQLRKQFQDDFPGKTIVTIPLGEDGQPSGDVTFRKGVSRPMEPAAQYTLESEHPDDDAIAHKEPPVPTDKPKALRPPEPEAQRTAAPDEQSPPSKQTALPQIMESKAEPEPATKHVLPSITGDRPPAAKAQATFEEARRLNPQVMQTIIPQEFIGLPLPPIPTDSKKKSRASRGRGRS